MFINTCACISVNKSRQLYLHPESMYSETCQDSYPPTADMYNSGESYVRKTKLHKRRNMAKPNSQPTTMYDTRRNTRRDMDESRQDSDAKTQPSNSDGRRERERQAGSAEAEGGGNATEKARG